MKIKNSFSKSEFLRQNWQQRPLMIKDAFNPITPIVNGEDLAGLACEEFIESRLIFANETQDEWSCEQGYFQEEYFPTLPKKNWTLLVQNVDDFVHEVKALSEAFDFLPRWRLDDVMISYATTGGGVGPHFDYYDVFLIQTSGTREWLIGQECNSASPLRDHPDMKLLETFTEKNRYVLEPGDMIYIPAGVAHWGTALSDECITASIGFRAPAYSELLSASVNKISENFTQDQRYKDSNIADDKFLIDDIIKEQFSEIYANLNKEDFIEELSHQFAIQVTEMRHPDLLDLNNFDIQNLNTSTLQAQANSRFAYRIKEKLASLYINGEVFTTDIESAKSICHSEFSMVTDKALLVELLNLGFLSNG